MGFTVVHQPSHVLVGQLASRAASLEQRLELARQQAEFALRRRQLMLEQQRLAMQQQLAAVEAAERMQRMQLAAAELGMRQAQNLAELQLKQAALQQPFALEQMRFEQERQLARLRQRLQRDLDAERFAREADLVRLKQMNDRELLRERFQHEIGMFDAANLDRARAHAADAITRVRGMELNAEGIALRDKLLDEYAKIEADEGLSPARRTIALRQWISKLGDLANPMYSAPPRPLEDVVKESTYTDEHGRTFMRRPDGYIEVISANRIIHPGFGKIFRDKNGIPYMIGADGTPKYFGPTPDKIFDTLVKEAGFLAILDPEMMERLTSSAISISQRLSIVPEGVPDDAAPGVEPVMPEGEPGVARAEAAVPAATISLPVVTIEDPISHTKTHQIRAHNAPAMKIVEAVGAELESKGIPASTAKDPSGALVLQVNLFDDPNLPVAIGNQLHALSANSITALVVETQRALRETNTQLGAIGLTIEQKRALRVKQKQFTALLALLNERLQKILK